MVLLVWILLRDKCYAFTIPGAWGMTHFCNHPVNSITEIVKIGWFGDNLPSTEREKTLLFYRVKAGSENHHRCFSHVPTFQQIGSCDLWKVQVQDNQVRFEIWITQQDESLFAISGDVKIDGHRALIEDLTDQQCIPRVVFDKEDFNGHDVSFDLLRFWILGCFMTLP